MALKTGLTIKLSFKANQALERLFGLLVIGAGLESTGAIQDEQKHKEIDRPLTTPLVGFKAPAFPLDRVVTKRLSDNPYRQCNKENIVHNRRAQLRVREASKALQVIEKSRSSAKGVLSKKVRDVLDTIMRKETILSKKSVNGNLNIGGHKPSENSLPFVKNSKK